MGRRKGWGYTLKKIFSCESGENRRRTREKKNLEKQRSPDLNPRAPENNTTTTTATAPSNNHNPRAEEEDAKLIEAEDEQNRHAYSVALATAAAEAAVAAAHAAAEVVRLTQSLGSKTKEEVAAIRIQTAFRGYMARRALRALRGLVRLKTLVGGQSVKRQAVSTLKCMQTLCRMQHEVRTRRSRMQEQSLSLHRQIQQKQRMEKSRESIGENWDDSILSKDRIEENLRYKHEAGMRRERALAYAYSRQTWRNNSSNPADQTFMDPENPRWGWMWLERWMPSSGGDRTSLNRSVSTKGDNNSLKNKTTQRVITRRPQSSRESPSTPKSSSSNRVNKPMRPPSPRGTSDSISNGAQSERCHRYSVASSSVRDDESLYSCPPAVRNYMASTESARARSSRLSSPNTGGSERRGGGGTPDSRVSGSAKKRLSFSGTTPVGLRRHSGPPRIEVGGSCKDGGDDKA